MGVQSSDRWERYSLWPIQVKVLTGQGMTLWGSGGEEEDRILVAGDRIHLFRSGSSLRDFVRHGERCNLSSMSGYGRLQEDSATARMAAWRPVQKYDLVAIGRWLDAPRWTWSLDRCSAVLDGLNLLWDMTRSLGEAAWLKRLKRGASPLGSFLDELTFLGEQGRRETLLRWSGSMVRDVYAEILQLLSERCVIDD